MAEREGQPKPAEKKKKNRNIPPTEGDTFRGD